MVYCWQAVLALSQGFSVSHALPESRCKEAWRYCGQDSWSVLARGTFHSIKCLGSIKNWGSLVGRCQSLLWWRLSIYQWVVSNFTMHHFFLGFSSSLSLSFSLKLLLYLTFPPSITKPYLNPQVLHFSDSFLHPKEGCGERCGKQASTCMVPSWRLGLNHNTKIKCAFLCLTYFEPI